MICNKDIAKKTAKQLLEVNAVKIQPDQPFTWASGLKSPIYCDNRITLSFPKTRDLLCDFFTSIINTYFPDTEIIAGVATGAIAIGALVANDLNLPFIYVRPEPKKHGRQNQIEGHLESGKKVLVIEDLVSTGMSSMKAIEALQKVKVNVLGMVAIFSYDFDIANKLFDQKNIKLYTLSDYPHLLEHAVSEKRISKQQMSLLKQWRDNPQEWENTQKT
jgi:orotate phosphoribosyltransferase